MANEAGALVRVAGMFSQRGFNIETLNVAPTEDAAMSRLTLVTDGTADVVDQIKRQLQKLVDVIDVLDMTSDEHTDIELALIKVRTDDSVALAAAIADYDVVTLDQAHGFDTLRVIGSGDDLNRLVATLAESRALVELARSGAVTMTPGPGGLRYEHAPAAAAVS